MRTQTAQTDLVVHDAAQRPRLLVEVKRRGTVSPAEAASLRAFYLDRVGVRAPFLLVTLAAISLWPASAPADAEPEFAFDAREELAPYFAGLGAAPHEIEPGAFEMLVFSWLSDLAEGKLSQSPVGQALTRLDRDLWREGQVDWGDAA
ncbi:MAG TPA: hypothetical protein VFS43_35665 [Polyangiaceae bacterium]|nr:hypothetical protein [Polyangiaceae bacterium]